MQTLKLTKKYEKYPEYKDSGVEWLGAIPQNWETKKIKQIIDYIQPAEYISETIDEENSDEAVPVLTANKAFIIGYTKDKAGIYKNHPAIIFDDFTTDKKFVDFNFKVRSTALKILKPRNSEFNFKYIFYAMQSNKNPVMEHNRHWISTYSQTKFPYPSLKNQLEIVKFLDEKTSLIDHIIEKREKQIRLLREEIISLVQNEQQNGKGVLTNIRNLVNLYSEPIKVEANSEYITLGLYNRGRGLFHKEPLLGKDIGESDFSKVNPRDLIISGQFAWEGAVALASEDESECVVSHRYYLLRDGVIKTEYLLALLMTKFGDHILNESSRGSAGRNKPLNIKILLSEKIRIPSKDTERKIELLLIKMNSARSNIKTSIERLEEYRSSLVYNVVTGKIKV